MRCVRALSSWPKYARDFGQAMWTEKFSVLEVLYWKRWAKDMSKTEAAYSKREKVGPGKKYLVEPKDKHRKKILSILRKSWGS